ncbi:HesA/MoeB/ThiF family protein [Azonexus sp.]|uniref:HesA/MoeB/ThiF family protein n=1 Tax=Azonexus sp. TaxID=1872668 RepID=UPI0039E6612B
MNDSQLLRYSRHILLDALGVEGQQRILNGRVLIVGAGGLGSPAALYLTAAGVGQITLADDDTVDLTNLQRQILHRDSRIGVNKALSGQIALAEINPEVRVVPLAERLDAARLAELAAEADLVLDCTDNFATRHAINRACVAQKKPLVSGAAIRFDGQVSVYALHQKNAPCYHCLFPEAAEVEETRCATLGVFAPLTGIIGSMQATEALKLLAGIGETLNGRLLLIDSLDMQWRSVRFKRDPDCAVCSAGPAA